MQGKAIRRYILCISLLALLLQHRSLQASERFLYDLKWLGIKAGEARLEFIDEGETFRVLSRAESAKWVSLFYKVDDRAESVLVKTGEEGREGWAAGSYRLRIREGRHRKDKEVIFDPENGKALYIDHLKKKKRLYSVPEDTFDPLSGFFLLRGKEIEPDRPVHITIFDSKRVWNVRVDVLGRHEIETRAGRFRTVLVKPNLESEGIFNRKGEILIYLTDDERHLPVLVRTEIVVGYVEAELVGGDF